MNDAPHGLATVGHDSHQLKPSNEGWRDIPEIQAEQFSLGFFGEAVVDREIPEIEEEVAHPRVLVVDDDDAFGRHQKVGVQQVVVAWAG